MGMVYLHKHLTGMNVGGIILEVQFLNSKFQLFDVVDATFIMNGHQHEH